MASRRCRWLLGDLGPAGRTLIRAPIDRTAWYNVPLFIELCTAIDRHWGVGDHTLNIELARYGCKINVSALCHIFIRLGSVDWILGKAGKLWHESAGPFTCFGDGQPRATRRLRNRDSVNYPPRPDQAHLETCWFVPSGDFERLANRLRGGAVRRITASLGVDSKNKWQKYRMPFAALPRRVLEELDRDGR